MFNVAEGGEISPQIAELLDVLAAASIVLDGSNTVIRASDGALTLGLVQAQLLVHKSLQELVEQARQSEKPVDREFELVTGLRGERSFVYARAARLERRFILLLVEDRTEAKRVDETRRDFIANISHELKTPIGAIGLLSEALQDGSDDPALVKRFAGNLQREALRLGSLVQDIILLSRLQSAESFDGYQPVDLALVINEAVDRNQVLAETKNVKLKVSAPAGHVVFGDFEALATAIKNLIENAILYSEVGSQVGIGLRSVDGVSEVTVIDNGVGISIEDQERIFERFYRVDQSRSRQTGGTGIGLSIVKHVALNHRGEVKVFSQPGLGSTFTFRVPDLSMTVADAPTDSQGAEK